MVNRYRHAALVERNGLHPYVVEFLEWTAVKGMSKDTVKRRQAALRRFIVWCDERELKSATDITCTTTVSATGTQDDETYHYLVDHIGTPQALAGEHGEVVWQATERTDVLRPTTWRQLRATLSSRASTNTRRRGPISTAFGHPEGKTEFKNVVAGVRRSATVAMTEVTNRHALCKPYAIL